jgi:hypothetical protein
MVQPRRRRLTGRPSRYRGKVRTPVVFTMTPEGHAALALGVQKTGLTKPDYLEMLVRRAVAGDRTPDVGTSPPVIN